MYTKYDVFTNEYFYPYAGLGIIFIKNTTAADITRTISFCRSTYWSSGYEGMGLFLARPNNTNANKASISALTWSNLYNNATANANLASTASITIPAGKTVAIFFIPQLTITLVFLAIMLNFCIGTSTASEMDF
ncbi:hypothetical protein OTUT144_0135 [Orientia tsutsugamushi str. UT144]|uniref:Uncharacterized protein n=1 Tax=Orientia tsutsugamushi str. UT144 TaxID=1441384 RepID=A0A0F3RRR7_ORITS|nr:hypothetical protein [Orientia tsutsugamushi]KJW07824.1 hypothetical protein OTUT144_0135 [Orientia tsutsugamushi str. UT144]